MYRITGHKRCLASTAVRATFIVALALVAWMLTPETITLSGSELHFNADCWIHTWFCRTDYRNCTGVGTLLRSLRS